MLPNEILPAIPRQKVKDNKTGKIWDVMFYDKIEHEIMLSRNNGDAWVRLMDFSEFEPVPEEPRPLRVGDKAKGRFKKSQYGESICGERFFTVKEIRRYDDGDIYVTSEEGVNFEYFGGEHCSPQECKDYFN